jgi:hypothetical protein
LHVVRDVVERKVLDMVVTWEMSHKSSPTPANFDAPRNVLASDVTLATLHPLRSAFISPAHPKVA